MCLWCYTKNTCVCVYGGYTKEQGIVLNLFLNVNGVQYRTHCARVGTHTTTSRVWWVTQRVGTLCGLHRYGGLEEVAHARYPFLLRCQKPMLECTRRVVRDGVG